jgi:hypothetical protein
MDWIDVAKDREQWRAVVHTVPVVEWFPKKSPAPWNSQCQVHATWCC